MNANAEPPMPPACPEHLTIRCFGTLDWRVVDVRTEAKGRSWKSLQEARIDRATILVRNMMHS